MRALLARISISTPIISPRAVSSAVIKRREKRRVLLLRSVGVTTIIPATIYFGAFCGHCIIIVADLDPRSVNKGHSAIVGRVDNDDRSERE